MRRAENLTAICDFTASFLSRFASGEDPTEAAERTAGWIPVPV
jgi:hypothetical protein